MKTVSAKEFQARQSAIMKEVAAGKSYQVTFHRKPFVVLSPARKPVNHTSPRGSKAAFRDSLKYTVQVTGDLKNLTYKELKRRMMNDKYGSG